MNRSDFVAALAARTGLSKTNVSAVVDAFDDQIAETLANGDEVRLVGFGTFSASERAARTGKNPATGAEIVIPASRRPKFKPGRPLIEAVSKKSAG